MTGEKKTGLELLREPFESHQIGKLPKPTKAQTDEVKKDFRKGERCEICKQWHHPKVIHLDYVGHAALTDRLLECDKNWNWEPFSVDDRGQPCLLPDGSGMWIRLTVCDVTRIGFGDAGKKKGGDAMKEIIGDGLRNAAMRFGAALDLWHKGDLHLDDNDPAQDDNGSDDHSGDDHGGGDKKSQDPDPTEFNEKKLEINICTNKDSLDKWIGSNKPWIDSLPEEYKDLFRNHCQQYYDIFNEESEEG